MNYLLDTNICIAWIKGDEAVKEKLLALSPDSVYLCSIVEAELAYGVRKSKNRTKNELQVKNFIGQFRSHPFDSAVADHYGMIRAALEESGTPIGHYDLMIAAIALHHNLTVVTRNVREFGRVPLLSVEEW